MSEEGQQRVTFEDRLVQRLGESDETNHTRRRTPVRMFGLGVAIGFALGTVLCAPKRDQDNPSTESTEWRTA